MLASSCALFRFGRLVAGLGSRTLVAREDAFKLPAFDAHWPPRWRWGRCSLRPAQGRLFLLPEREHCPSHSFILRSVRLFKNLLKEIIDFGPWGVWSQIGAILC